MQIRQAGTRGTDHSNRITRVPCFTENYTPYLPRFPFYPSPPSTPLSSALPSHPRFNRRVRFSCVRQTPRCTCLCAHRGVAYHRLSNYRGIELLEGNWETNAAYEGHTLQCYYGIVYPGQLSIEIIWLLIIRELVDRAFHLHIIWRDTELLGVFPSLFAARQV